MKTRLDQAIAQAKQDLSWDDARASRVLAGVVRRHRIHRTLRRGGVVATGAAVLVLVMLRLAPGRAESTASAAPEVAPEPLASIAPATASDAGYGRD